MSPTPEGSFRKPTPYPRRSANRRPPQVPRRPRFRSGLALSVVLHLIVLGGLVQVAGFTPGPGRFDVFAADPVDAAPEHAVVPPPPEPLRPTPIVDPSKARLPRPDRSPVLSARAPASAPSRVVVSATSALPPDPPTAPIVTVAAPRRSSRPSRRYPMLFHIQVALTPSRVGRYPCLLSHRLTRRCRCPRPGPARSRTKDRFCPRWRPRPSRRSSQPRHHRSRAWHCIRPPRGPTCCGRCRECRSRSRRPCRR